MLALVVTHAFGNYAKGDQITDPALVEELKDSPNVVRVMLPA